MLHLIGSIIIGFLAGLVARAVTPGAGPTGFFLTAALGIAGSVLANYVGKAMGWYGDGNWAGFIASVVGAVVLLIVYNLITRKKA